VRSIATTRAALLEHRALIRLADRGRTLLQEKRRELLRAFQEIAASALTASDRLALAAALARAELLVAEALDGPDAIRSAGWAAESDVLVTTRTESVMGVRVPAIDHEKVGRSRTERGFALAASSPRVDGVAERYEGVVEAVLGLAATEARLLRFGEEIQRTTQRANALEHVVLPRLDRERRDIALKLQEREREEAFRLRRVKRRVA
jgi:V/A-type H+-transporting ATPase subunit D